MMSYWEKCPQNVAVLLKYFRVMDLFVDIRRRARGDLGKSMNWIRLQ